MGTTVCRKGVYSAVYQDRYGKQKWIAIGKQKAEAQRIADDLAKKERLIRLGIIDSAAESQILERKKPLLEHLQTYENHIKSNNRHKDYIASTILDIKKFLEFSGIKHIAEITMPSVDRWRNHCQTIGYPSHKNSKPSKDSKSTINRRIVSLKSFLNYLVGIGIIPSSPLAQFKSLNVKGYETFQRRALTLSECSQLLMSTKDENRKHIYLFAILTGFRKSEIASMTPANFDFENRKISISARYAKNKRENQSIDMFFLLVEPLKSLCDGKSSDEKIFKFPAINNVVKFLKADLELAGVSPDNVDFHSLRHTNATLLSKSGISSYLLMQMTRHKDIKTSARYVHSDHSQQIEAMNKTFSGLLSLPQPIE